MIVYTDQNGNKYPIAEMEDSHLLNALNFMEKQAKRNRDEEGEPVYSEMYPHLNNEADRRDLFN